MIKIYHNNSCSKSCAALASIKESGREFEIINYLEEIPSVEELKTIVEKLGCKPHDLIRINESIYQEKFAGQQLTDDEWLMAMYQNPIIIQRPIVIHNDQAVIARLPGSIDSMI